VIEHLNKQVDLYLQDRMYDRKILEGYEHQQLLVLVGKKYIKLKETCRVGDFYIEEAIAMALEELRGEVEDESGVPRDYDRS